MFNVTVGCVSFFLVLSSSVLNVIKDVRLNSRQPVQAKVTVLKVKKGMWLSRIAADQWGDKDLWPIIWDDNRKKIGNNPNRVRTGIELELRSQSDISTTEREHAIANAQAWKAGRPPRGKGHPLQNSDNGSIPADAYSMSYWLMTLFIAFLASTSSGVFAPYLWETRIKPVVAHS